MKSETLMGRAYSSIGEKRHAYTVLEEELEVKGQLGKSRHSGTIILKWGRNYILWEGVEWIVWLRIGTYCEILCTR
jgi:hypothetical protein